MRKLRLSDWLKITAVSGRVQTQILYHYGESKDISVVALGPYNSLESIVQWLGTWTLEPDFLKLIPTTWLAVGP